MNGWRMALPDHQTIMLPLLSFVRDGKGPSLREAIEAISDHFRLPASATPPERGQYGHPQPSGLGADISEEGRPSGVPEKIDGEALARMMIDHNVGVTAVRSYDLKRIDSDYFTDE